MNDIEILNKKRYIRMTNNSVFVTFQVPLEVIKCLQKMSLIFIKKNLSSIHFLSSIDLVI